MVKVISQRELRNDSAQIMRALDLGESFVVTRNGATVGELRPLRRERLVASKFVVEFFSSAPELNLESLRRDLDEVVDQAIEPRA